jgi:transcriptional regulator with XRE-family HTH domain
MSPILQNDASEAKPLAALMRAGQDVAPQHDTNWEGDNVSHSRSATPSRSPAQPREKYLAFAAVVEAAMNRQGVTASEVARRMWGTIKNERGKDVARNRDRIAMYRNGISYPEPDNLARLAEAIGVSIEELQIENPPPQRSRRRARQAQPASPTAASESVALPSPDRVQDMAARNSDPDMMIGTHLPADKTKMRLQLDKVLDWQLAFAIQQVILEAETGEPAEAVNKFVGRLVVGGPDTEKNGTK